jgi:hypothetical protein
MMKKYVLILIVALSMIWIAGCGGFKSSSGSDTNSGNSPEPQEIHVSEVMEGYIFEVDGDRVLILENAKVEDFDKSWNDIFEGYEGYAIWLQTKKAAELQVGQKVKYWVEGAVAESYPMQGKAHNIIVIAERPVIEDEESQVSEMAEGFIFEVKEDQLLILDNVKTEDFDKSWNDIVDGYEGSAIWLQKDEAFHYQVGQKVQYWIDGPVAKSFPAQGKAHKVEVIAERPLENSAFRNLEASGSNGQYIVTGEARVFEATMNYAVSDGHYYLLEDFHTLNEGAPEWSAFSLDIQIPEEDLPGNGTLMVEVFEYSAKDGSIVNLLSLKLESFE